MTTLEASDCPFCSSNELLMMEDDTIHYILCLSCRACGPTESSAEEALESWSTRIDQEDIADILGKAKRILSFS